MGNLDIKGRLSLSNPERAAEKAVVTHSSGAALGPLPDKEKPPRCLFYKQEVPHPRKRPLAISSSGASREVQ